MTTVSRGNAMTRTQGRGGTAELVTRALVVLGLAADALIHWMVAPSMDIAAPGGIGGGNLFRIQGTVAALVALVLLVTGRRWAYALAALVALSALVPVLLYHFVDVPPIGPIPRMYDPFFSPEKVISILGEAVALGFALRGLWLTSPRPGNRGDL